MLKSAMAIAAALTLTVTACSSGGPPDAVVGEPTAAPTTVPAAPASEASAEPPAPATPAALAEQLATVEAAIRDPRTPTGDLSRLGWTQQVIYRTLVRNPEWQPEVPSLLPAQWRPVAEANASAGAELRALSGTPRPELPAWRIVAPAPAAELVAEYRAAEAALGVPWHYLAAIHLVETRMGRIRGTSTAGAQGPMQFIPTTWDIYGEGGDINSNHDAILAAARLLEDRGAPADMAKALYAYNPSQRYVRAVTAYAELIGADERAYLGYHQWRVYYVDTLLPEGYGG